jgi:hypothetical protein
MAQPIAPIFEEMLRELEPNLPSDSPDQFIHHTSSPNLSGTLSLRFPHVVAVVPPEVKHVPIRWTPELPP